MINSHHMAEYISKNSIKTNIWSRMSSRAQRGDLLFGAIKRLPRRFAPRNDSENKQFAMSRMPHDYSCEL